MNITIIDHPYFKLYYDKAIIIKSNNINIINECKHINYINIKQGCLKEKMDADRLIRKKCHKLFDLCLF